MIHGVAIWGKYHPGIHGRTRSYYICCPAENAGKATDDLSRECATKPSPIKPQDLGRQRGQKCVGGCRACAWASVRHDHWQVVTRTSMAWCRVHAWTKCNPWGVITYRSLSLAAEETLLALQVLLGPSGTSISISSAYPSSRAGTRKHEGVLQVCKHYAVCCVVTMTEVPVLFVLLVLLVSPVLSLLPLCHPCYQCFPHVFSACPRVGKVCPPYPPCLPPCH